MNDLTTVAAAKPTPGPWRVFGPQAVEHGFQRLTILAGYGDARFGVAHVTIARPRDALEASANARLIVAAPRLAAIGVKLLEIFDHPTAHVTMIESDELRGALKEAGVIE